MKICYSAEWWCWIWVIPPLIILFFRTCLNFPSHSTIWVDLLTSLWESWVSLFYKQCSCKPVLRGHSKTTNGFYPSTQSRPALSKPGEVARVVKTFGGSAMVRPGRVSEFQVWWEIREWWIKDGNRRWHYLRKWVWRPEVLWEGMKLSVYNVVCKTLQNTGESRSDAWLMGGLLAVLTLKQWCSSSETLCNAHRNAQNEQDACRKSLDLFGLVSETLWSSLHCSTLLACDWDITSIMQSPSQDEYLSVSFARCSRWNFNLVRAVYFVPGFKLGERLSDQRFQRIPFLSMLSSWWMTVIFLPPAARLQFRWS